MKSFKVIIAGGRDFADYTLLKSKLDIALSSKTHLDIEIISGTARGADRLGEKYSMEAGHSLKKFPADWDTHGKSAGHIRNRQMGDYADALVAFWDGSSRGTKGMIEYMRKLNKPVRVIKYSNEKSK